jgi:sugar phosphate isomerase/epimerase
VAILLSTGSLYSYGVNRTFEIARQVGFDGLEVLVDSRWDTRQPEYLDRLRREFELPILALHTPFAPQVPGWPRDTVGKLKSTVTLARELGVDLVVAHAPRVWERSYDRWLDASFPEYHEDVSAVIAIENMPAYRRMFGRSTWLVRSAPFSIGALNRWWQRMIRPVSVPTCRYQTPEDMKRFGKLVFDVSHWGAGRVDILEAYRTLREQVVHVHLANRARQGHQLLDNGLLPINDFLRLLASDGYTGHIAMEFSPETLGADSEKQVRERLTDALAYCRAHFVAGD